MKKLIKIFNYIVNRSNELKNKFTDSTISPIEFVCVFCQNNEEYTEFTNSIETLGTIVETTQSSFTYLLKNPINTPAGPLRLVKIRKPDPKRGERGDADFNTDYQNFKERYQKNPGFELIKRETLEMLRLSNPDFDVSLPDACRDSLTERGETPYRKPQITSIHQRPRNTGLSGTGVMACFSNIPKSKELGIKL